jgi:hypothetical protein
MEDDPFSQLRPIYLIDDISGKLCVIDDSFEYNAVMFKNCNRCEIKITKPLIKIIFYECRECLIYLDAKLIRSAEIIKTHDCNIYENNECPFLQIELSSNLRLIPNIPRKYVYVTYINMNIVVYVDGISNILPTHMFSRQKIIQYDKPHVPQIEQVVN